MGGGMGPLPLTRPYSKPMKRYMATNKDYVFESNDLNTMHNMFLTHQPVGRMQVWDRKHPDCRPSEAKMVATVEFKNGTVERV